jgi:3-oxoadipate enol-lactonase
MTHAQNPVTQYRVIGGDQAIGYLDAGPRSAPAIVLLHSLGADHRLWQAQVGPLAAEYRVIAPDSRGHGRSAWAGPLTVEDWVDDLDRVLDHSGVRHPVLAGVSMGGVQALAFAASRPGQARALIVADSFAELNADAARAKTSAFVTRARAGGMAGFAEWYLASTFTADPLPPAAEVVRDAISGMEQEAFVASAEACFGIRLGDALGRIQAPTLVLWGDRDAKTPRELSEYIAARIAGAEFGVVPDAGHLANTENPGEFTRLVTGFLGRVNAKDAPGEAAIAAPGGEVSHGNQT